MTSPFKTVAALGMASAVLAGCNLESAGSGTGTLSLDITDAPVDEAVAVNVVFEGVIIQSAADNRIEITYDEPKTINLLDLQGGETAALLEGETLAAGDYEWIRLKLDADEGTGSSNIEIGPGPNEGTYSLTVPSGQQTGLKLVKGFTIPANGSASFTIDFDLRKSVIKTGNGQYKLKPTLRLVDNTTVGAISGTVAEATIDAINADEAGACDAGMAVYVYEGSDVMADDVGSAGSVPITTAMVEQQGSGELGYTAAFLVEGDYTSAFTCDAELDDPEGDDDLSFTGTQNVTVSADATSQADF
ncbi:DUF4382 domain-containing protein [Saccharospirillum salsuginis]|uniref:DUF4382 domain-containing protein n=1 Tax=Saccharospirillum salsuginis TaxID=418750 RepID=A0A918N9E4_9GAMM|nr:DUF4382 domain-containing protein [Saccharospirillum salsuginis]GGX50487.1 hypothetical protein GCM10007392_17060 [Saccharospirillum salsuginis]